MLEVQINMIVRNLIHSEVPTLRLLDHVSTALNFFDDYKLTQIPVIGPEGFLGLIDEEVILNAKVNSHIKDLKKHLKKTRINEDQTLFDALRFFRDGNLCVLPVIDKNNKYIGCVHEKDLLQKVCEWLKVTEPGGILHIEVSMRDYSLAQIAQIVEGNGAKILNTLCLTHPSNSKKIGVLIKINQEELSGIIQTFERYEYQIIASFHKNIHDEGIEDRFNSFIRYLNT